MAKAKKPSAFFQAFSEATEGDLAQLRQEIQARRTELHSLEQAEAVLDAKLHPGNGRTPNKIDWRSREWRMLRQKAAEYLTLAGPTKIDSLAAQIECPREHMAELLAHIWFIVDNDKKMAELTESGRRMVE